MKDMQQSKCDTIRVPAVQFDAASDARNPVTVYRAGDLTLRLLVRNISPEGLNLLLSYDNPTLQMGDTNPSGSYTLPPGGSDVFTLLPGEVLYAVSPNGSAGLLSYAVSVAFPFEVKPG